MLDGGPAPSLERCDENTWRPGHSESLTVEAVCTTGHSSTLPPCSGLIRMTGCKFVNNSARSDGGAIYNNRGRLEMSGCEFTGNAAEAFHPVSIAL